MTRNDRTLIENEGANAASGDDPLSTPSGDPLGPEHESPPERTEEQPELDDLVGAPEQLPGKPGQQLAAGEG
jgi:hypothetical protein